MKTNQKSFIKVSKQTLNLPTTKTNIGNQKPMFLFANFQGNSIKTKNFNNYYKNQVEAIKTVNNFIEKIKEMETINISDLFEPKRQRKEHCHLIDSEQEVNRIEDVLRNGYKFNEQTIKNFEKNYYEFGLERGERVIFVKTDNYIELLFIDNNHMIYKESSRNIKIKEKFEYPCCFGKINFQEEIEEYNIKEIIKMMIEDYKEGNITNIEEFAAELEEILNDKSLVNN